MLKIAHRGYTCHNKNELKYLQEYNVDGIVSNILIE